MLRLTRFGLAALAASALSAVSIPASSQTFTLPEIGLQNSGSCPQIAVRERTGKTMVPFGCLDGSAKTLRFSGDGSGLGVTPNASAAAGTLANVIAGRAPLANPAFAGTARVTGSGVNANIGCSSLEGQFATDGTLSWQPSCFGNWLSNAQTIPILPTRGSARDGSTGQPVTNVFANSLIQTKGDGSQESQPNGQIINVDVFGGTYSAEGKGNATGLSIFGRQRPGPNGERPAPFWSINTDQVISAGSGNILSMGIEIDITNQNADCAPGAGNCTVAHIWTNGGFGYPITAFLYGGGAHTYTYNGNVTTTGNTINWSSAPYTDSNGQQQPSMKFGPSIKTITVNGTLYRVNYLSDTQLSAYSALPTNASPVRYSAYIQATHNGVFFNGYEQTADNDAWFNTAAFTGVKISGFHYSGIDTTEDTSMRFSMKTKQGQQLCFNGEDNCSSYIGNGIFQYRGNGVPGFEISTAASGNVDYVQVLQQPAGAGAVIRGATNYTLSSPLRLFGAGSGNGGGVQLNGPLTAPSISTSGGTVRGTLCIDTSGNIYAKTTSGACL